MSEKTRFQKMKEWLENNRFFSALLVLAFLTSGLSTIFSFPEKIRSFLSNQEQYRFENKLINMIEDGCLLFKPDYGTPLFDEEFIQDAYREYWRETDIAYADSILILGYVDDRYSDVYALSLATRRARSAKEFLIEQAHVIDIFVDPEIRPNSTGMKRVNEFECGARVKVYSDK